MKRRTHIGKRAGQSSKSEADEYTCAMSEKPLSTPLLNAPSPAAHKLELLRQLFPQAVQTDPDGSVRVDAAQIQRALDPANAQGVRVEETGYELRWVGKQEAYHTAFARTDKIVAPAPADSKAWDSTGNLLIKGDNLDALKLLRQSYFGQVKLIYIDPPYNTKSDEFIYRDDFTARQTDILAQLGYSADNVEYIQNIYGARTHSGWLSFMYPRLLLAKDLLRDDGVIFISIDDNEQAQLKMLCDEVFGQENWVGNIIWKNVTDNNPTNIAIEHENMLCYARDKGVQETAWKSAISDVKNKLIEIGKELVSKFKNPSDLENAYAQWFKENKAFLSPLDRYKYIDQDGVYTGSQSVHNPGREGYRYDVFHPETKLPCKQPLMGYRFPKSTMDDLLLKKKILFGDDESKIIELKVYAHEYEDKLASLITLDGRVGSYELRELFPELTKIFDNPKPLQLLTQLLSFTSESDSIILDFFAGSGTTGEAVMRLNAEDGGQRQFILVQIPQPIDPKKQKEAHSFVTQTLGKPEATIFEITAERLRRAGDKINAAQRSQGKPEVDAGFRVYTLADDPHALVHRTRLDEATQADVAALQAAIATPQPEQRPVVLANLLLTEGLPLSATLAPLAAGGVADALWQAQDTLLVLDAVPLAALVDLLRQRKAAGTPVHHVSVYAPWVHDDNFLQGVQTLLEAEGFSADRLRLRG